MWCEIAYTACNLKSALWTKSIVHTGGEVKPRGTLSKLKPWYWQRSHNQHGRKEMCSRYPVLNANACTLHLEKLEERWRKD